EHRGSPPLRDGGGGLSGAALGSPSAPSPRRRGNDGATVHASDPRDSVAAVGAGTAPPGGGPEHGAQRRGRLGDAAPPARGRRRLGGGGRPDRRRPGSRALPAAGGGGSTGHAPATRLCLPPHRAPQARRDARAPGLPPTMRSSA